MLNQNLRILSSSHRAVTLKGQEPPVQWAQESGSSGQVRQLGLPEQEGQFKILPEQVLQLFQVHQRIGLSGQDSIM